jgi:hypothetical protein
MHLYTMINTCFSLHIRTYLYNVKTEGTIGNGCIQDCANNLCFSYPGQLYFTKQKNNQPDTTTPMCRPEGRVANEEGMSDVNESEAMLTMG